VRPSLRFLALAIVGWTGLRAATLGALPGAEIFRIERGEARPSPPIMATEFAPIPPVEAFGAAIPSGSGIPAPVQFVQGVVGVPIVMRQGIVPVYRVPAAAPSPMALQNAGPTIGLPERNPDFYSRIPSPDEWPLARIAAASMPVSGSRVIVPGQSIPAALHQNGIDRIQLSAWALLRSRPAVAGPRSLASAGTLGGSQAGARLNYNVTRQIAATLRTSSDVGRRGGEVAAGVRVQPLENIPVWLTAERRQRLGRYGGGRNAFALFAEGGVYDEPLPWQFALDAYLQAGVVGFHHRDRFIDGGFTMTRPVYKNLYAGLGIWGGAQPGLYRLDAGPRVTMRLRNNLRIHLDWRQRLAGNAQPGSGPALTLGTNF
jgi:hypothetical protein